MGMTVTPSPSTLQGPVAVTGDENLTGAIRAAFLQTTVNGEAQLATENTGGFLRLIAANAVDANPGANMVKMYVRPGSVSGLSLRVRAGAAGAETILLDNIPV